MNPEMENITHANGAFASSDLLALMRGFSRVLWSIPIGLLLFTGMLDLAINRFIRLPTYVISTLLFFWGLMALYRVRPLSPAWSRYLRLAFVLTLLLIYFSPFIYWWMRLPFQDHFAINLLALMLAITWLLWIVNRLAEEVAGAMRDRVFLIEARLCRWSVLAIILVPLSGYVVYALAMNIVHGMAITHILQNMRYLPHVHWMLALILLPMTLTISIAWKAKECALSILKAQADQSTTNASAPGRSG